MVEWKRWILWLLPIGGLVALLGWQLNWGQPVVAPVSDAIPSSGKPVAAALLPEYKIEGGVETLVETVNRTLFNPTRRPAPPVIAVVVEPPKPRMQKGQFVLTGVSGVGDTRTAFFREVAGGKVKMVKQGEQINGLVIAEVQPARVVLKMGDETEELGLRIISGPRATIAAAPPPTAAPPMPVPGMPMPGGPAGLAGGAGVPSNLATIEERRRAARAAEAAAAGARNPADANAAAAQPGAPVDPGWNAVYQRYMQRNR